jgi:hypothetical protein
MKNVFKPFGVIALVAIIGFSFAALSLTGCGGADDSGGGPNPVMYTVTFDANGGTVEGRATKAVEVEDGEKVTMPEDPVKASSPNIFWGWFDDKTSPYGNIFTGTIPITADKTVYARWGDTDPPPQFDVTFNANGGKFEDGKTTQVIKVYQNDSVIPPWATRNNWDDWYMLFGWNTQADGNGTIFDENTPVTALLTVYAQWKKPEDMPAKKRWWSWIEDTSTATLEYSVDDDGVCTITVGGKVDKDAWKALMHYGYTEKEGTSYTYVLEAWTESGTYDLSVGYFENLNDEVWLFSETIPITTERQTYTIYGGSLPRLGEYPALRFSCADRLGTFYVKILEIKEYALGKLTITNFSGILTQNNYINGYINIFNDYTHRLYAGAPFLQAPRIKGDTITMNVWEVDWSEGWDKEGKVIAPYTGNTTVAVGDLWINHMYSNGMDGYTNIVPITFTNGDATINFRTQMQKQQ